MMSYFTLTPPPYVLFQGFSSNSAIGMAVTCGVTVLMTVLYEGLKCLRLNLAERQGWKNKATKNLMISKAHLIQTILHLLELVFGYIIMLLVMTYNVWVFVAVIAGAFLGLQICTVVSSSHVIGQNKSRPILNSGDVKQGVCDKKSSQATDHTKSGKTEEVEQLMSGEENTESGPCRKDTSL